MKYVAFLAAVGALSLVGCSSSDSQPATAGSGGAASDAGGAGGSAGTVDGGGGTADASGGAAGASGAAGQAGNGGGPPAGAKEQCAANWTGVCESWERCVPAFFAFNFADQADCVKKQSDICVAALFSDGSNQTLEGLKACGDAIPSPIPCSAAIQNLVEGIGPASCESVAGNRDNGQSCEWAPQCKSRLCLAEKGKICGTCDTFVELDGDCTTKPCVTGLVCSAGVCVTPGKEGDSCNGLTAPCLSSLSCSKGKCVPQKNVGDSCSPTDVLACGYDHFCNTKTQQCGAFANLRTVGQTCGILADGTYDTCVHGAVCRITNANAYTGVCDTAAKETDACDDSIDYTSGTRCETGTVCVSGICVGHGKSSC
jgi:hypothetical protein